MSDMSSSPQKRKASATRQDFIFGKERIKFQSWFCGGRRTTDSGLQMPSPSEDQIVIEERLSSAEIKFEKWRRTVGLFLGPPIFILLLILPLTTLTPPAHKLLAILGLVITFWVTEAIPIPVTALLGAVLCVVMGVGTEKEVLAPFADPIVFLFIGSFILAEAMKVHRLDRRFAYAILSSSWVGNSSTRLLLAVGLVCAGVSMWISNTATTAMFFPIALGILRALEETGKGTSLKKLSTGMMLLVAYAASVGGIGTPVGTPPNLIGLGMIDRILGREIPFFEWMSFAIPITLIMLLVLFFLILLLHRPEHKRLTGIQEHIKERRRTLGKWKRGEKNALLAFLVAVTLWILPGVLAVLGVGFASEQAFFKSRFPEGIVALVAACFLFFLPTDWKKREFTLSWRDAVNIDWGTIILFGGGLTLGGLIFSTQLAHAIGSALLGITGANSQWSITFLAIFLGILMSETTSNTASANMVIPVMIAIAQTSGVSPIPPALGACLGASFGFMLPVSTPPNAIVYASGKIPITKMIKTGIFFDLTGLILIWISLRILCPLMGLM
jgi:sodium-dependent dicarboxylate transporter 2/3/5